MRRRRRAGVPRPPRTGAGDRHGGEAPASAGGPPDGAQPALLPPPGRRGASGFTLVEALAALTITGAVLVTALAAVGADLRSSRAVEEARRTAAATETALQRLALRSRRELRAGQRRWRRLEAPLDTHRWRWRVRPREGRPALLEVVLTVRSASGDTETVTTRLYRPRDRSGR